MGRSSDWKLFILALAALLCTALPWLWVGEVCLLCRRQGAPADAAREASAMEPAQTEKLVAFTFDDGPRRATTGALLDGLAQRGAHATFFLIGTCAEENEDLICRMEAEGHQVGIHSATHQMLTGLSSADFYAEVGAFQARLAELLDHEGFVLRPPYGRVDAGVERRACAPIILWSVDTEDWSDHDAQRIAEHIVSHAEDGDIILLHDIYPASVEGALSAMDALMAEGYYLVTVDELFAARGIELENGKCYRNAKS